MEDSNLYLCNFRRGNETAQLIVTETTPDVAKDYATLVVEDEWKGLWSFVSVEPIRAYSLEGPENHRAIPFETKHSATA